MLKDNISRTATHYSAVNLQEDVVSITEAVSRLEELQTSLSK